MVNPVAVAIRDDELKAECALEEVNESRCILRSKGGPDRVMVGHGVLLGGRNLTGCPMKAMKWWLREVLPNLLTLEATQLHGHGRDPRDRGRGHDHPNPWRTDEVRSARCVGATEMSP